MTEKKKPAIQANDKVKHAGHSNSPTMRVRDVEHAIARCEWFDNNGVFREKDFQLSVLKKIETRTPGLAPLQTPPKITSDID